MNITLTVQSSSTQPGIYRTDITINSGNGITPLLFVKQRVIKADGTVDDTFAAVASPEEIEDLPERAPELPGQYFRDSAVSLVSSDLSYLLEVVQTVLDDLALTLKQAGELETFASSTNYTIDSVTGVVES